MFIITTIAAITITISNFFFEVVQNYCIYKNGTKVNSTVDAHAHFIHIFNDKRYSEHYRTE